MKTVRQEYREFINKYFQGLHPRIPLFYGWEIAIRFDLQNDSLEYDEYFQEVRRRASTLFQSAFNNSDQVFLLFMEYKFRKRKIKFSNFVFKQIPNLQKKEVCFLKERCFRNLYPKSDLRNIAIVKTIAHKINYKEIIAAIGNTDFPPRTPRLDNKGCFSSKEVYFINIDQKLIFHMYDDRGLDIIANDKDTLKPLYTTHNEWILDYDRNEIDKVFQNI